MSRKTEPTKNSEIRRITEFAALATAFSGFSDSAAAIVVTSAPTMEKITVTTPAVRALGPVGQEAPVSTRGC